MRKSGTIPKVLNESTWSSDTANECSIHSIRTAQSKIKNAIARLPGREGTTIAVTSHSYFEKDLHRKQAQQQAITMIPGGPGWGG